MAETLLEIKKSIISEEEMYPSLEESNLLKAVCGSNNFYSAKTYLTTFQEFTKNSKNKNKYFGFFDKLLSNI